MIYLSRQSLWEKSKQNYYVKYYRAGGKVIFKDYFGHSSLLTVQLDDKSLFKVRVTSRVEVSEGQRLNLGLREYPRAFAQTVSV